GRKSLKNNADIFHIKKVRKSGATSIKVCRLIEGFTEQGYYSHSFVSPRIQRADEEFHGYMGSGF
ncbi:hypothetical protein, partial [Rhodohalobacter sp. 8-1]|uniref:hypothetical protein n=1 Tax=Rhodohalobacter sp. 8-1 TaxID=3131972 RepID=UPI0030EC3EF6